MSLMFIDTSIRVTAGFVTKILFLFRFAPDPEHCPFKTTRFVVSSVKLRRLHVPHSQLSRSPRCFSCFVFNLSFCCVITSSSSSLWSFRLIFTKFIIPVLLIYYSSLTRCNLLADNVICLISYLCFYK